MTAENVRVLSFAASSSKLGGAERYLELLALTLAAEADWRVRIVGEVPFEPIACADYRKVPVGPKWSRSTLTSSLLNIQRVKRSYLEVLKGSDVVHMQFKKEQVLLSREASKFATVVWTEHGIFPHGLYGRALARAYVEASRYVAAVVCVSDEVRSNILALGVDASKLHVIENAIDGRAYAFDGQRRAELRSELGLADSRKVLITTSRLENAKGIDRVIRALSGVTSSTSLLVVGDGEAREALAKMARDIDVDVRFLGFRSDVAALLSTADVFVLPSRPSAREGLPLSMLQAAASGMPLIVTSDSGVVEHANRLGAVVCDADALPLAIERRTASVPFGRAKAPGAVAAVERSKRWASAHIDLLNSIVS